MVLVFYCYHYKLPQTGDLNITSVFYSSIGQKSDIVLTGIKLRYKQGCVWDPWMAQVVKPSTLGFGSGHDLMGGKTEPCVGLAAEGSPLEILSLTCTCALSPPPSLSNK